MTDDESATSTAGSPARRGGTLRGQTLVVIGGSAGIGLETARLARDEGAELIITARNPGRLEVSVGSWAPASLPSTPPTSTGSRGSRGDLSRVADIPATLMITLDRRASRTRAHSRATA